jgi:iron complex transport system substrate-binding protein
MTTRLARCAATVAASLVVVSACGGGGDASPTDATAAVATSDPMSTTPAPSGSSVTTEADTGAPTTGASGGPRVVEHQFGTTEVPADPQRIVALSEEFLLADLLALGVIPVASTSNDPNSFGGIDPAATEGIENIASASFNLEQLAALRPDLLLAYPDYIELVGYDTLAAIAPTVAIGDSDSDWRERFILTAEVLGLEEPADALIGEVEAQIDAAREVLHGVRVSALSISPGPFLRAYTDDRTVLTEIMSALGMQFVPDGGDTDSNGRLEISLERLGELSGDLLLLLQTTVIEGEDAAVAQVEASPLWPTLPAVSSGAVVTLDRLGYPGAEGAGRFAADLVGALRAVGL